MWLEKRNGKQIKKEKKEGRRRRDGKNRQRVSGERDRKGKKKVSASL